MRGRTNHGANRAPAQAPQAFAGPNFWWIASKSSLDIVKIKSKITYVCMAYINKHHVILSQYHSRWISMWMIKLVNYVLLNYYLQISSHSTLLFVHGRGPWQQFSQGPLPKSLVWSWIHASSMQISSTKNWKTKREISRGIITEPWIIEFDFRKSGISHRGRNLPEFVTDYVSNFHSKPKPYLF